MLGIVANQSSVPDPNDASARKDPIHDLSIQVALLQIPGKALAAKPIHDLQRTLRRFARYHPGASGQSLHPQAQPNHSQDRQLSRHPGQPRHDELPEQADPDIAPDRNQDRHHQTRRHKVPGPSQFREMQVEDEMPKRRQVADSEAKRPDQEDCGEPVGPASPDPQQDQQMGADFERRQQLAVERLEVHRLLETLRETVASVTHPFVLRPHPLHRPAHRHGAAEHQAVVR